MPAIPRRVAAHAAGRKNVVKKIAVAAVLVLGVIAVSAAMRAPNWGSSLADFEATCAELGGVVHGTVYRATCSYEGGVATLPAAHTGWTIDVAQGTVATRFGNVTEKPSNGTIVVACHDERGERMPLSNGHCVKQ
jgi:hypothetical protein